MFEFEKWLWLVSKILTFRRTAEVINPIRKCYGEMVVITLLPEKANPISIGNFSCSDDHHSKILTHMSTDTGSWFLEGGLSLYCVFGAPRNNFGKDFSIFFIAKWCALIPQVSAHNLNINHDKTHFAIDHIKLLNCTKQMKVICYKFSMG